MPGSKAIKNRLTLFGGNAAGDMKLKSLLLHPSENSRALPIVWKSNAKTWVTQAIFSRLVFFRTLSHFPGYYPWGTEILLGEGHPIQHFATWQCSRPGKPGSMDESHGRCQSSASATEYYAAHLVCASVVAQLVKNLPAMQETLV